jgi:hypothetical protein
MWLVDASTFMSELSPAARATLDAVAALYDSDIPEDREIMIATLRAAANHIHHDWSGFNCVDALCEIAAELETKYHEPQ